MLETPDITSLTPTIPGLICAYHFHPGQTACRPLPIEADLEQIDLSDGFLWLHLNLADLRTVGFLESFPGLTPAAVTALTTHDAHPAVTLDDQLLYGTLVDFQRDFDKETNDIGWLHFFVSDKVIITTRLQPIRSVDRIRNAIEKNAGRYRRPIDLFETLVSEFQRTLISLVMEFTEELNLIEDYVYDNAPRDERRRLAPVRRTVVKLHRHLRTVLTQIRHAAAADDDDMPPGFDDVASRLLSRLEAVDHDVYALQERARLLHEEIDSKLSSETNRHLYILSIMTAFLLPPSLVTGFFGMNTEGLPFAHLEHGTAFAFALMALSVFAAWWLLKRTGIF